MGVDRVGKGAARRLDKQLVRLLRTLARPGAHISGSRDGAGLRLVGGDAPVCSARPDAQLVGLCLRRGLIERVGEDGLRINEAGRLALRRLLAGGDAFQVQHQQRVSEPRAIDGEQQQVLINDGATPLGWLARRRDADGRPLVSAAQFAAGERLAADFTFAGLTPRITSSWSGSGASTGARQARSTPAEMTDARLAARQRLRRALDFVGGDLADVLLDVCCLHTGLGDIESERGWPRRSGKLILQLALDRLAEHYGMNATAPRRYRARIEHWGADGYRPSINGAAASE